MDAYDSDEYAASIYRGISLADSSLDLSYVPFKQAEDILVTSFEDILATYKKIISFVVFRLFLVYNRELFSL
jgi:hypothetical protein